CRVKLDRNRLTVNGIQTTVLASLEAASGGFLVRTASLNSTLLANDAFTARFTSDSERCTLSYVRIAYELPNGFVR
ncbi:MAG: hypothetical protein ABI650_09210, partial [Dokdonella sp.]